MKILIKRRGSSYLQKGLFWTNKQFKINKKSLLSNKRRSIIRIFLGLHSFLFRTVKHLGVVLMWIYLSSWRYIINNSRLLGNFRICDSRLLDNYELRDSQRFLESWAIFSWWRLFKGNRFRSRDGNLGNEVCKIDFLDFYPSQFCKFLCFISLDDLYLRPHNLISSRYQRNYPSSI